MAVAPTDGYRRQVRPGETAAQPERSASAFGAEIGGAMREAGQALHEDELRARRLELQRQREADAAEAGVYLARRLGDLDTRIGDLRDGAGPGAAGHRETVTAEVDASLDQFLEAIPNEDVRRHYQEQVADSRRRLIGQEDGWFRGRRIEHQVTNLRETWRLLGNQLQTRPDPAAFQEFLGQVETGVEAAGLSADIAAGLAREGQAEIARRYLQGLIEHDPAAAGRVIKSQLLNQYLTGDDLARLTDNAQGEVRVREADARRVAAGQEEIARNEVQTFNARIAAGDQPTDAEFDRISALARQYAWGAELFNNEVRRADLGVNRRTRNWSPPDWDREINALRALPERNTDQNVLLAQLERLRPQRVREFAADPQGRAARAGNPAPAVDWEEPTGQELAARSNWAEGYARANGLAVPPYLSAAEMAPLRQKVQTGAAGRLEVAGELRSRWGAVRGSRIARQIAPADAHLRLQVSLPPTTANLYGRGIEVIARNPALIDAEANRQIATINLEIQEAVPPAFRTAVFDGARMIAAGMLDTANRGAFDAGTYRMALHRAMGAEGPDGNLVGGIGSWGGGEIWLPPRMGQAEFERRITRATPEQMVAAAGGRAPRWTGADGRPGRELRPSEVRQLQLETVAPGVYRARGPTGGILLDRDGRPWQLDVRRLP